MTGNLKREAERVCLTGQVKEFKKKKKRKKGKEKERERKGERGRLSNNTYSNRCY